MSSKIIIGREYPDKIIEAVKSAKNEIRILMYDWRWYSHQPAARIQKLNNELLAAVRRGVKVRAVLNMPHILQILKNNGIDVKVADTAKTMHIKMVIIDDKKLFVGSHNLSINAFELNHEMSVYLEDPASILRCTKFFESLCLL